MIRLVLFDIDGTLIRTGGAGMKSFERTFASAFGVPNATTGISFAGRTDTSLVRQCFLLHGIEPSEENFARFFEAYVFWLHHLLGELHGELCPGVDSLIQDFQRLPDPPVLALLTGNIRLGAEIKLRHFALWEPFVFGAYGDDSEDRNQLAVVARERGQKHLGAPLSGSEILLIGDTPLDVACGQAIGARVLAVATGGHSTAELRCCNPTWVCKDLEDVNARDLCGARALTR